MFILFEFSFSLLNGFSSKQTKRITHADCSLDIIRLISSLKWQFLIKFIGCQTIQREKEKGLRGAITLKFCVFQKTRYYLVGKHLKYLQKRDRPGVNR